MNSLHTTSPFNAFKILDHELNEMPLTHDIPRGYEQYVIPGSVVYSTTGRPGTFLFQEIAYPGYTFWLSHYFTVAQEKVLGKIFQPALEIHFILLNNLLYRLKGFDWQAIEESQYNFLAAPHIENEVYFDNKNYLTFDIHPSLRFMEKIASRRRELKDFLKKAAKGLCVQFFDLPVFASPRMLFLIKEILEHLKGEAVSLNLDNTVRELIELALVPSQKEPVHFNYFEIESIYLAEKQMITHMDDNKILEKQIDIAPINNSKFRRGFQKIFGERPHAYLRRKRLEKARYLLKHYPHIKIKNVALEVGYSNPDNFSTIYKNFFGVSPLKSRQ